jgi:small-conductance mechanosensitive channel
MDTKYLSKKFNLFLNNIVDNIPTFLTSIFIFIIFYIIAEYYQTNIIPPKIKLIKSEQELQEMQESKLYMNIDTGNNNYNNDDDDDDDETNTREKKLIYYQLNWLVYYSIIIFGLIFSLVNLGFNVATIITLIGSMGLALGLALQETIKNLISGIYISINKLFSIDDIISIKPLGNLNSTLGKIIDFNLNYTTIIDNNNIISMIPNSFIQNNILTNITISENYKT